MHTSMPVVYVRTLLRIALFNSGHTYLSTNCYQFTDAGKMDGLIYRARPGIEPVPALFVVQEIRLCVAFPLGHTGSLCQH